MMILSIIIPHYQVPTHLLQRCLKSVEAQGLDKSTYEVIIVDDGSPTSPMECIKEFAHLPIRYFSQIHNCQGAARNTGLRQAQGKYVVFLDADDYLFAATLAPLLHIAQIHHPDILRFQFQKVKSSLLSFHSSLFTLHSSLLTFHSSLFTLHSSLLTYPSGEAYMYANNLHDAPWEYLFRRTLATSNEIFFPEGVYLEDCIFTARLHHVAKSLIVAPIVAYAYYQHPQSTVHKTGREHAKALLQHHFNNIIAINNIYNDAKQRCDVRGLKRKNDFLIVDYIQRMCRTVSWKEIRQSYLPQLHSLCFYPLRAQKEYGWKYRVFRLLTYWPIGIRLLQLTIWPLRTRG